MIALTDFMSYEEVRAIIGVDSTELTDAKLGLPLYATTLQRALRSMTDVSGMSLLAHYDIVDAIDEGNRTESQEDLYYTVRQYAAYVVADAVCSGLSMFALKSDTDGKASQTRFSSEATFKDVVKAIKDTIISLTGSLNSMLGESAPYVLPTIIAVAPDIDRVTNETP